MAEDKELDVELLAFANAVFHSKKTVRADLASLRASSAYMLNKQLRDVESNLAVLVADIQAAAQHVSQLMADEGSEPDLLRVQVDLFKTAVFSAEALRYRHSLLVVALDEKRRSRR